MAQGQQAQKQKNDKQKSMFEIFDNGSSGSKSVLKYPEIAEWPEKELLGYEKETLGFFISSHPLAAYEKELKKYFAVDTNKIQTMLDGEEVIMGGVPVKINEITTRKGERMAFVTLEDLKGSIEIIVFSELYKKVAVTLQNEQPVMLKGKVSVDERIQKAKIQAEQIVLLSEASKILTKSIHFNLDVTQVSKIQLEKFKNILKNHPGNCTGFLHMVIPDRSETIISLPAEFRLNPSEGLVQEVEYLLGSKTIIFN